eukprot:30464-Pleurochrysis_carterae.AAC.1
MKHHETDLEIWEIGQAQPAKIGEAPLMENSTYQFACPQCGLVLQALLKTELTSVQCGECMDVFDVQMPSSGAQISPPTWVNIPTTIGLCVQGVSSLTFSMRTCPTLCALALLAEGNEVGWGLLDHCFMIAQSVSG